MESFENFKPVKFSKRWTSPFLFKLRCILDLQLGSIVLVLIPELKKITVDVLDVGCGEMPWRKWISKDVNYCGIDVDYSDKFSMQPNLDRVIYFDGMKIPFDGESFNNVLCIEVLEHTKHPASLIKEMYRVLRKRGKILISVPFSARQHHVPHDYYRYTKFLLRELLEEAGFEKIVITDRGNQISVLANKLVVLTLELFYCLKINTFTHLKFLPLLFLVGFLSIPFLLLANALYNLKIGGNSDPLGFFISAEKSCR